MNAISKDKNQNFKQEFEIGGDQEIEIAICQIEQNLMKFLYNIVYYHHILLTTARYCTWSYALMTFC